MHAPGIWGILIVAVVVIVLFGRGKIAGLMGEVASGIKSFQKGMREEETTPAQINASTTAEPAAQPAPQPAAQPEKKDA